MAVRVAPLDQSTIRVAAFRGWILHIGCPVRHETRQVPVDQLLPAVSPYLSVGELVSRLHCSQCRARPNDIGLKAVRPTLPIAEFVLRSRHQAPK